MPRIYEHVGERRTSSAALPTRGPDLAVDPRFMMTADCAAYAARPMEANAEAGLIAAARKLETLSNIQGLLQVMS